MNVLLLNAGAKNRGATQDMLQAARDALPEDWSSELLCLGDCDLRFCRGCKACYAAGDCFQKDDVRRILDKMEEADILIIAAPSYWGDVPGQFKVFIDRCTPYADTNPNPDRRTLSPGKRCYALALRAGQRPMECEHIIECVRHWCGHMGIETADSAYFCGIDSAADMAPRLPEVGWLVRGWFAPPSDASAEG